MSAKEIFEQFGKHFVQNNMFESGLRSVLWTILKTLNEIGNGCVELLEKAYSILTFNIGNSDELKAILDPFSSGAFVIALMTLVLVLIGLFMILGNRNLGGAKIIQNILLGVLMFTVMPLIINTFNGVFTDTEMSLDISLASSFDANTHDLLYMFTTNGNQPAEDINEFPSTEGTWINSINICEVIRGSKIEKDIDDVFSKVYKNGDTETGGNGEIIGVYLEPFATDYYYRYHVDMLPVFITCIATILVMFFTFFKAARLAYEMLWNQLFLKILSVTDLVSGTKLKETVKIIGGTYVVLLYIPLSVRVFCAFQNWLFTKTTGDTPAYNMFEASLLLIAVAMAVIDGPNLIEKVFGIDAGIKSGFHTAMGIMAAGRAAAGFVGRGVNGVKSAYNFGKDVTGKSGPLDKMRALRNTSLSNWAWDKASGNKNSTGSGEVNRAATDPTSARGRHMNNNGADGRENENKNNTSPAATNIQGSNNRAMPEDAARNAGIKPTDAQADGHKERSVHPEKPNGELNRSAENKKTASGGLNRPAADKKADSGALNRPVENRKADDGEPVKPAASSLIQEPVAANRDAENSTAEKIATGETERSLPTAPIGTGAAAKNNAVNSPKKQAMQKADALTPVGAPQKKAAAASTVAATPASPVRERQEASTSSQRTVLNTQPSPPVSGSPSVSASREVTTAPTRNVGGTISVPSPSTAPVSNHSAAPSTPSPRKNVSAAPPTARETKTSRTASAEKGSTAKQAKRKSELK